MLRIKKVDAVTPKLRKAEREIKVQTSIFLTDVSEKWKKSTKRRLSGSETGKYPAKRTGHLQSMVNPDGPDVRKSGDTYRGYLTVDTEYATIQEEGGLAGRYHSTRIPPRPYAKPALATVWAKLVKKIGDYITRPFK